MMPRWEKSCYCIYRKNKPEYKFLINSIAKRYLYPENWQLELSNHRKNYYRAVRKFDKMKMFL